MRIRAALAAHYGHPCGDKRLPLTVKMKRINGRKEL
jgi:hypothetical protein